MIILIYLLGKTTKTTTTLSGSLITVTRFLTVTEHAVGSRLGENVTTWLGSGLGLGAEDGVTAVGLGGEHCYTTIRFFL
jgi:hypothetical protein